MEIPRGVGDLLDAAARVVATGARIHVTIIGDGRDAVLLRERAHALHLSPDVVSFTGRLPREDALRRVSEAEVGIVPHHADEAWNTTIPNKLFDYMAAGLAVVSSDAAPPKRILEETGAGLVYRSHDPASLAHAILSLRDPEARRRMAEAGRAAIVSRYNWEADSNELLRAVEQTVSQSNRSTQS